MSSTYVIEMDDYPESSSNVRRRNDDAWKVPIEAFTSQLKDEEYIVKLKWKQKQFYKHQNELIHSIIDAQEQSLNKEKTEEAVEESRKLAVAKNIAIYGSVAVNFFLLFLKIVAAVLSGSLSVIASALDSFLDLLSGSIIFFTDYVAKKTTHEDYPAGKSRFEPVGLVIFSACMFTATLQLLLDSIQTIITQSLDLDVTLITYLVLATTIGLKFVLWLYCRSISGSETVNALALDHRNDVISNCVGCGAAMLGYNIKWWIDPVGAILISLYLMSIWAHTGYSQLSSLTGKTAPPELLQALTVVARNHHRSIVAIDTVRAYHYGYNFMCELDIVLPPDMPLCDAHDIGESLQNKLESIEQIERAFVHLDYETEHKPEHSRN